MPFDVVALGETLIDLTPCGINEQGMALYAANPGGAPANVLAQASLLGAKTAFIGKVGNDAFGDFLKKTMDDAGIDTRALLRDPAIPTTLAFVQLDAQGERSFSFYRKPGADMMLTSQELPLALIEAAHIFHFGSVSLTDEPAATATLDAARFAKRHGVLVSYDPNYRAPLWSDERQAVQKIRDAIALCDILKVSEEEMTLLTGEAEHEKGARKLQELGAKLVLISMGEKGCGWLLHDSFQYAQPFRVKTCDTTGAGDSFLGAFLSKMKAQTPASLSAISDEEIAAVARFSNAAGALTTMKKGAIPAMRGENEIGALLSAQS